MTEREHWNQRYRGQGTHDPQACFALQQYQHLLPKNGKALDLAAGAGGNALLLAQRGLTTEAWDISEVALQQLQEHAAKQGLILTTHCADLSLEPPPPASFDVITVSRFLHRPLCPAIATALKPGGILLYQTFTRQQVTQRGPGNPDYRLQENELLQLFAGLRLLAYREEGERGDLGQGWRDEALLVAYRPPA